jgi:hypothetical protein
MLLLILKMLTTSPQPVTQLVKMPVIGRMAQLRIKVSRSMPVNGRLV